MRMAFAAAVISLFATTLLADDLPDLLEHLESVRADVVSTGDIAIRSDFGRDRVFFRPDGGGSSRPVFQAQLAVGREVLADLKDRCTSSNFGVALCRASISAEV